MRRRLLLALAALPASALAQTPRPTTEGPLGHLSRLIGSYEYNAVLDDPAVTRRLRLMLGPRQLDLLRRNMQVQTPIAFDGAWIILRGLAPHQGGAEEAILAVQPSTGLLETATLNGGSISHVAQRPPGNGSPTIAAWIAERSQGGRVPVLFRMNEPGAPPRGKPR